MTLNVSDASNAGQIYAGTDLSLSTQGDLTNTGALQALRNLRASLAGTLFNDNGRMEAGSGQGGASLRPDAASTGKRVWSRWRS